MLPEQKLSFKALLSALGFEFLKETDRDTRTYKHTWIHTYIGGVPGVMVIVVGNGHGETSSNPGRD